MTAREVTEYLGFYLALPIDADVSSSLLMDQNNNANKIGC